MTPDFVDNCDNYDVDLRDLIQQLTPDGARNERG
jgi:hypothetical protein